MAGAGAATAEVHEDEQHDEIDQEVGQTDDQVEDGGAGESEEPAGEEHVVVSLGDQELHPDEENRAPEWVRELRKQNREKDRRMREMEQENARLKAALNPAPAAPSKKPTLAECDYDEDRFEAEMARWQEHQRQVEEQARQRETVTQAEQESWNTKLAAYGQAKTELNVPDFEDAEETVKELLSVQQQGILVAGAKNPALLVLAIGRNRELANKLKAITDPVAFAWEAAQLEAQLKVSTQKVKPKPESNVRGTAPVSGSVDAQLEKLREKAARTGNASELLAYKRKLRAAK